VKILSYTQLDEDKNVIKIIKKKTQLDEDKNVIKIIKKKLKKNKKCLGSDIKYI